MISNILTCCSAFCTWISNDLGKIVWHGSYIFAVQAIGENNACIPPTLEGWVYIIPIHGPLDGPLYTWAQYTPTKGKNYQERSSSNSGPWYWAQPPPACPISSVWFSVHLSFAIPPIHLVLHGSWSGTWHKLHSSLDLLILFSSKWWIILVPGIRHQLLQSFHFLYLRYLQ